MFGNIKVAFFLIFFFKKRILKIIINFKICQIIKKIKRFVLKVITKRKITARLVDNQNKKSLKRLALKEIVSLEKVTLNYLFDKEKKSKVNIEIMQNLLTLKIIHISSSP